MAPESNRVGVDRNCRNHFRFRETEGGRHIERAYILCYSSDVTREKQTKGKMPCFWQAVKREVMLSDSLVAHARPWSERALRASDDSGYERPIYACLCTHLRFVTVRIGTAFSVYVFQDSRTPRSRDAVRELSNFFATES